jgi:hypothetical protein
MRAPICIASDIDGYDKIGSEIRTKLDNALWTGEWSGSFANQINAIHQRTRKRFHLIERIQQWSHQQLLDPSNEAILRWLLREAVTKKVRPCMPPCLSDEEVERLCSIGHDAPREIIHSKTSIDHVPQAVLSSIFSYLHPSKDLLGKCIRVSRHWFHVVPLSTSCTHWRDDESQDLDRIDRVAPNWFCNLQHLSLARRDPFDCWSDRFDSLKTLTSLTIDDNDIHDEGMILHALEELLQYISLKRLIIKCTAKFDLTTLNSHPSLTHCSLLNYYSTSKLPQKWLVASQLQSLDIHTLTDYAPLGDDIIDLANANSLHTLSLEGQWIIVNANGAASSLRNVTYSSRVTTKAGSVEMILQRNEKVTSSLMEALAKWPNITRIKLNSIPIITFPSSIQSWQHANLLGVKQVWLLHPSIFHLTL